MQLWRLWRHPSSVEYQRLLKKVYIKIGAASSSFIWSYSNLAETFSLNTADWKSWIWINKCFFCSDDVINIMLAFWQMQSHSQLSFKNFAFLTQIMKRYAIVEIFTKKKIICDTVSINMRIWDDEAYRFTNFSNITLSWRHNDFILDIWVQIWDHGVKFSKYNEFQLKNIEYRLRYCNVPPKKG